MKEEAGTSTIYRASGCGGREMEKYYGGSRYWPGVSEKGHVGQTYGSGSVRHGGWPDERDT